jgi:hypothetical protein
MVRRAYAYGTGGAVTANDKAQLQYLNAQFAAEQYRLPDLLRTIALSRAFSHVAEKAAPLPNAKTAGDTAPTPKLIDGASSGATK